MVNRFISPAALCLGNAAAFAAHPVASGEQKCLNRKLLMVTGLIQPSQGLNRDTPVPSKSPVLRVTNVRS